MQKNKKSKEVAKKVVAVLNTHLQGDANSVSCIAAYQPKVPNELSKFKRDKR
ncbi:MAG: cyclic lactone autoinducer peptide [Butyrivibrio sp.]|nr:cyclic lactone autoinducer peptide [Muribaculum sp.]MCM1552045.1 cyclic lactone autoinducer peptide [Butyrivibrio sp.]